MKLRFLKGYLVLIILFFFSGVKDMDSRVFEWRDLDVFKTGYGAVRNIMKSPTRSLDLFELKAVTLNPGQSLKENKIDKSCDELVIIKEGIAEVSVNGEIRTLGEGSIAVVSQGDRFKIGNRGDSGVTFFTFLFKPKFAVPASPVGIITPISKEWNTLEFKPSENGGRRDIMRQPLSALKELEIHTTTLKEGMPSHSAHTHPDEEIILVRFGDVEETISGKPYPAGPGSVIFLTNDDFHGIRNAGNGQCEYYAIRWLVNSPGQ